MCETSYAVLFFLLTGVIFVQKIKTVMIRSLQYSRLLTKTVPQKEVGASLVRCVSGEKVHM